MVNQADVYQHFRKSEAPFVAQVLDWIEQAQVEYRPILTAFFRSASSVYFTNLGR